MRDGVGDCLAHGQIDVRFDALDAPGLAHRRHDPVHGVVDRRDAGRNGGVEPQRLSRTADEYAQDLAEIKAESERLTELIEVLLALSRDGVETATVNQHDFDLVRLVRSVHGQFAAEAAAQRLALELDVPEHDVTIRGSEPALRRLVSSLPENAIAHTASGAVTLGVEDTPGIRLFVRDTGEGISEPALERIFDRLYRVDPSRGGDGDRRLGLGLSIARRIAEAHDAELSATSQVGQGSEFSIRFPNRSA